MTGFNPTGTVTFALFGPDNANCVTGNSGTALQSWVVDLSSNGTANVPAASGYKTSKPGTYNWVATYNGDNANLQATSGCGSESVVVGKASPTIVTTASDGGPVGTQIHDTAQVSGGANPTGTVSFFLYPPSDTDCTSGDAPGWVQHVDVTLGADGSATSAATPYTTTRSAPTTGSPPTTVTPTTTAPPPSAATSRSPSARIRRPSRPSHRPAVWLAQRSTTARM